MSKDIEPSPAPNESGSFNGETLVQQWVVEGLVTEIDELEQRYVVTKVLSGEENIYDTFFHSPLRSPCSGLILSPEPLMDASYRELLGEGNDEYVEDGDYFHTDELLHYDKSLKVGDRIRIERLVHNVPSGHRTWSGAYIENVQLIESGIDIQAEEERVFKQRQYIRENLAAILRRLEQLQLGQRERLRTAVTTPVRWNFDEHSGVSRAEYTYGDGVVEDHFVNLTGQPYRDTDRIPLGGDLRFSETGRAFAIRDIVSHGESKELALVNEPLVELKVTVWTETVLNPEVAGVRVGFIVDGVHYKGIEDIEFSSRFFESPGHELIFDRFIKHDEVFDGVLVTPDELDAIGKYDDVVREGIIQAARYSEDSLIVHKAIEQGASDDLVKIRAELEALEVMRQEAFAALTPTIDAIKARPLDTNLETGGRLLIPQSRMQDVQVVITLAERDS